MLEQLLERQRQRKGKNPLQERKPPQDAETQNNESKHQRMMENLDPLQFLQQQKKSNESTRTSNVNCKDKGIKTLLIMAAEPVMIIARTSRVRNMKNSHLFFCSYSSQ